MALEILTKKLSGDFSEAIVLACYEGFSNTDINTPIKEDGDMINLKVKSETILRNFIVTKNKKKIEIILDKSDSIIEIEAINVGTVSPNTVFLEIKDSTNNYKALTNLKAKEKTKIVIPQELQMKNADTNPIFIIYKLVNWN